MKTYKAVRQIVSYETVVVRAENPYDARVAFEDDLEGVVTIKDNDGDYELQGNPEEVKETEYEKYFREFPRTIDPRD